MLTHPDERNKPLTERTAELTLARNSLQAVLDSATQVALIATTPQGVITVFNSGAEQMLGYTSGEMVGKQTPDILHLQSEVVARGPELAVEADRQVQGFEVFVNKARRGWHDDNPVEDYALLTLDSGGYVTSWNSGAEHLKGYASGEIIGRHFS